METNPSERTMAALAHFSGIFFPLLGPFCFLLFGGKSRFVRFHALHSLVGTLLLNLALFVFAVVSIGFTIVSLYRQYQDGWRDFSLWQILIKSALTWIALALVGIANTVLNLIQAFGASNGRMPGPGITTGIVRKALAA